MFSVLQVDGQRHLVMATDEQLHILLNRPRNGTSMQPSMWCDVPSISSSASMPCPQGWRYHASSLDVRPDVCSTSCRLQSCRLHALNISSKSTRSSDGLRDSHVGRCQTRTLWSHQTRLLLPLDPACLEESTRSRPQTMVQYVNDEGSHLFIKKMLSLPFIPADQIQSIFNSMTRRSTRRMERNYTTASSTDPVHWRHMDLKQHMEPCYLVSLQQQHQHQQRRGGVSQSPEFQRKERNAPLPVVRPSPR